MIGGLQRLLITALLITPQKTGHRGPYFDWLRAQGQQVRFGVLFLIKGAINHLHTSEMRRRFRKGPFHSSRGYHPFSRSKTQSQIAPTLSKKRQSQISDRGKVGSNLPIQGVSLKFRGFIFPLFFCRLHFDQMAVISKYFSFLTQAGQGVCCCCAPLFIRAFLSVSAPTELHTSVSQLCKF